MKLFARTMVATVALAVGACGGSADRLSASEFRAKANALCADQNKQFDRAFADFPKDREPSPEEMQTFFRKSVPIVESTVDVLAKLRPPKTLSEKFDAYVEAQRAGIAHARAAAASPDAAAAAAKADDPDVTRANRLAGELDLKTCVGE